MPGPEIVSPVPAEEISGWTRTMASTFLGDPDRPETESRVARLRDAWQPERAWGVRDRGRWVGTLRTEARHLTLPGDGGPGGELTVDALTNVTVAATHRRRGLMGAMLAASLRSARERGDAVSILIAAEWPIYGRFGYAPATFGSAYTLRRSRAGSRPRGDVTRVRQVERDEFADVAVAVHEATRRWRWHGQLDRDEPWWERLFGRDGHSASTTLPHNWLLHEGTDGTDGLLAWKATPGATLVPPFGAAEVWMLAAASADAYGNLWAYLGGIDGVDEVVLHDRPVDEPARWLLGDGRTLVATQTVDFMWLRILDVPLALGARRYAVPGTIVLEVRDDAEPGSAAGRYRLTADREAVTCTATGDAADLEVNQRDLASAYLGGVRLNARAAAGTIVEHTPGALARADAMFATAVPPWNPTWF